MIGGMSNGNVIRVVLNRDCALAVLREIANYKPDLRQMIKRLLTIGYPKHVPQDGIDLSLDLDSTFHRVYIQSYLQYGEILMRVLRNLKLSGTEEYLIVLPYCMDSHVAEVSSGSTISKLVDTYLQNSLTREMKQPSIFGD